MESEGLRSTEPACEGVVHTPTPIASGSCTFNHIILDDRSRNRDTKRRSANVEEVFFVKPGQHSMSSRNNPGTIYTPCNYNESRVHHLFGHWKTHGLPNSGPCHPLDSMRVREYSYRFRAATRCHQVTTRDSPSRSHPPRRIDCRTTRGLGPGLHRWSTWTPPVAVVL